MLAKDNKIYYIAILHYIINVNNFKHSSFLMNSIIHLQPELQCKYTTSKSLCQEFWLNIFTINFRKISNNLIISNLPQPRHNYNSPSKRAN